MSLYSSSKWIGIILKATIRTTMQGRNKKKESWVWGDRKERKGEGDREEERDRKGEGTTATKTLKLPFHKY